MKTNFVRLAATFPKGSAERRALLREASRRSAGAAIDPEEVLSSGPRGASVADDIDAFVAELIVQGQRAHRRFREAVAKVEGYYPPDKVDPRALRLAVSRRVESKWGDDPMLPFLVRLIVDGDYIY